MKKIFFVILLLAVSFSVVFSGHRECVNNCMSNCIPNYPDYYREVWEACINGCENGCSVGCSNCGDGGSDSDGGIRPQKDPWRF